MSATNLQFAVFLNEGFPLFPNLFFGAFENDFLFHLLSLINLHIHYN